MAKTPGYWKLWVSYKVGMNQANRMMNTSADDRITKEMGFLLVDENHKGDNGKALK